MLENAFCRVGELVVHVTCQTSGTSIDGNLYKDGQSMDITLLLDDSWSSIRIQDLNGNGDNTNDCNKGYGSTLVTSTFDYIMRTYSAQSDINPKLSISNIAVNARLSNNGSVNEQESHSRRVHFWQKMGLTVKDPDCDGSLAYGTLANMKPPAELLKWHRTESNNVEDWIDEFEWNKTDDDMLARLRSFDINSLLANRLQAKEDNKKRIRAIQNSKKACEVLGAVSFFALHGLVADFSLAGTIIALVGGYILGGVAFMALPFKSNYERDELEYQQESRHLNAELDTLLSAIDNQWQFFYRLNKRFNNEFDSFITERRLNIDSTSEMVLLEEFFKKTKVCASAN